MIHRPRHLATSRAKRGVAAAAAVAAVGGGLFGVLAPTANATPNDPNVIVSGGAGCHSFAFASAISFALDNGETASANFSLFSYKVTFHNIASNGTSGTATVTCGSGAGAYTYTRAVSINRPVNGNHQSLSFPAG